MLESEWTEQDGFSLLRMGIASAWSGPDGNSQADWTIRARSIPRRMRPAVGPSKGALGLG
jgi:hypothetical protein